MLTCAKSIKTWRSIHFINSCILKIASKVMNLIILLLIVSLRNRAAGRRGQLKTLLSDKPDRPIAYIFCHVLLCTFTIISYEVNKGAVTVISMLLLTHFPPNHPCRYLPLHRIYRGYYMAAWRYQISLWVLKNISRVSAANEWNIFSTHQKRNFVSPSGHVMFYFII